uniref:Uncharacterized protein n=1 Tax=Cynoglossus semilaevis TaxID=244447 RepID=A0A3P8VJA1_CYNSE
MLMHSSVLVLLSHLTVALCCDSLTQYSHYSSISLKLVDNMGGQLSGQDPPVYFPYRLYRRIRCSREERQLSFVRESLELIFDLYRTNNTYPATWEKNTIQHFLISLERLMDTLDQCVSNKYQCRNIKLRKYYRKLIKRTVHATVSISTGVSPNYLLTNCSTDWINLLKQ